MTVEDLLKFMLSFFQGIDKEKIEGIITRKYNENFATLNKDKLNQLPDLVNELQYRLNKINPKKDSFSDYRFCNEKITQIQNLISNSFN